MKEPGQDKRESHESPSLSIPPLIHFDYFVSSTLPLVGFQSYTFNALNARIDGETNALANDLTQLEERLDARIQAVDDKVDALTSEVQFLKGQLPLSVPI